MDPLLLGLIVGVSTVVMLFSGIPIAFGLCFISVIFLVIAEGFSILNVFAETFYAGLNSFVLLSIPMFILMGMAVAKIDGFGDYQADLWYPTLEPAQYLQL